MLPSQCLPRHVLVGEMDFTRQGRPFLGERHAVLVLDDEARGVVFHGPGRLDIGASYLAAKDRLALRAS
jgi:hypothetical protein